MENHNAPLADEKRWLANLRLALEKWLTVKPEEVTEDLLLWTRETKFHFGEHWTCETQACFGGHLSQWPEFQAMGVYPSTKNGAPRMNLPSGLGSSKEVAEVLFGDRDMFSQRRDDEVGSDHEVVAERLRKRIGELS